MTQPEELKKDEPPLGAVQRLVEKDLAIAEFLLDHGADPLCLAVNDNMLETSLCENSFPGGVTPCRL